MKPEPEKITDANFKAQNQLTSSLINSFFKQMKVLPKRFLMSVRAFAFAAPVFYACAAFAQGVSTVPVGIMSYTIPAANGATPTNVALSLPLHDTAVYVGAITDVGANTLTNSAAPWTDSAFANPSSPFFVRIRSGAQAGRVLLVTANSSSQLTVDTRTPPLDLNAAGKAVAAGDTIEIVPADTLGSLFGTTQPIFQPGDISTGDIVRVWNDASQTWQAYYNTGAQWQRFPTGTPANDTVIYPDRALFITRRGGTDVTFTLTGEVPSTAQKTQVGSLAPGSQSNTLTGNLFPVDTTLKDSGIASMPGWQAGDINNGDIVRIWNVAAQTWQVYYYTGVEWQRYPTGASADTTVIPAGSAVFLTRRASPTADNSVWNIPLPYSLN